MVEEEERAIAAIIARLGDEFDDLPAVVVAKAVEDAHAYHAKSRVRDFVPLFVEREAREQLSAYRDASP